MQVHGILVNMVPYKKQKEKSMSEKLTERQMRILILKGEAFDISRRQAILNKEFDALDKIRIERLKELNQLEREELAEKSKPVEETKPLVSKEI